jgi:Tol biopolymer transport system component
MSLKQGDCLGAYQVLSALGAGGMGEVYRARDTKLNRDVAIKVLLPAVANDPDRLARFSREAQVLASLNHPNIAAIYGIEEIPADVVSGFSRTTALVMELVEGEDLSQRIARGAIPIDEALPIARQIAEALEAAHDHGIIHRDLKPANIKLRSDGTVKVLDFGLAKQGSGLGAHGSGNAANSPTLSIHATEAGIILGTAAYMSPEQAAAKSVDKRSDLWAFGVVLFEMLTGRQAFKGETLSHVIAGVLKDEPDWPALPATTPVSIRRLLRRCLEKDRKRRLPDAADIRLEIDDARAPEPVTASRSRSGVAVAIAASLLVGGLIAAAATRFVMRDAGPALSGGVVRFGIQDTEQVVISRAPHDMAMSPDGRQLAFIGFGAAGAQIWIRALDTLEARALPGTEDAVALCWSPDGQSLAFLSNAQIKTITLSGGAPQTIATPQLTTFSGFDWGVDGTLVYAGIRGVSKVSAAGGSPINLIPALTDETYDSITVLPDGRHFLIAARSTDPAKAGTFAIAVDGGERTRILDAPTPARYAMGRLMFVRDRVLYAQPFDLVKRQLEGKPVPLAESVDTAFSASRNGAVAYVPLVAAEQTASTQLSWVDRAGRLITRIDQAGGASSPALSPDGRRLAVSLRGDIWIFELDRGVLSRVTNGPTPDFSPSWLPDGQRVIFHRALVNKAQDAILSALVGSTAAETVVFEPSDGTGVHAHPTDVSADGRYLAYETGGGGNSVGATSVVAVRALTGDPRVTTHGPATSVQTQGAFSPDGRWLSYSSDLSGRFEVYVDGVPDPDTRVQVSATGGHSARWSRDGKELFYLAAGGTLMAVPVRSLQPLEFGQPVKLFQFASPSRGRPAGNAPYDVTADGQRFIINAVVRQSDPSVQVVLNWPALIAEKAAP